MGNYESLRIDVGCTMDTDEWLGSDQEAYEEVSKKVHEFLKNEEQKLKT